MPDEILDDFSHYFWATDRLTKENIALRAEVARLTTMVQATPLPEWVPTQDRCRAICVHPFRAETTAWGPDDAE